MTRRSYNNDRYTGDGVEGHTKKSAAKAKPVREAAGTVYVKSEQKLSKREVRKKEQVQNKKRADRQRAKYGAVAGDSTIEESTQKTEKAVFWRKIWWVCIAVGIISVILAWNFQVSGPMFIITMIVAYGAIAFALYIEFGKIRKYRKKESDYNAEKKTKKQIKHEMEAEQLAAAQKAAKKSHSKIRNPFAKKSTTPMEDLPMDESSEH